MFIYSKGVDVVLKQDVQLSLAMLQVSQGVLQETHVCEIFISLSGHSAIQFPL